MGVAGLAYPQATVLLKVKEGAGEEVEGQLLGAFITLLTWLRR